MKNRYRIKRLGVFACLSIVGMGLTLSSCSIVKEVAGNAVDLCSAAGKATVGFAADRKNKWYQAMDDTHLARVASFVKEGDLHTAWEFLTRFHYPESRFEAIQNIAMYEENPQGKKQPQEETLWKMKAELDKIDTPIMVFYCGKSLFTLSFKLPSSEERERLQEEVLKKMKGAIDEIENFGIVLPRAKSLGGRQDRANRKLGVVLNEIENRKTALFYEISLAELTFQTNPLKAREELQGCKEKIWRISSAQQRAPFLIQLVSFELDIAKDIAAAKKAIATAKQTIQMIFNEERRKQEEAKLAYIVDTHSNVLCQDN